MSGYGLYQGNFNNDRRILFHGHNKYLENFSLDFHNMVLDLYMILLLILGLHSSIFD